MALTPLEAQIRIHALLCSIGFLILLPLGTVIARYLRTFSPHWWSIHSTLQLFIACPVIFTGWYYGRDVAKQLGEPAYDDPHKKAGLALLILYVAQLGLGILIHYVKMPSIFKGHRPPQNYIHAILGLSIIALASWQVHRGYTTQWPLITGNVPPIPRSAKVAWLALVIVFWTLYAFGLVLLPRQYRQERKSRESERGGAAAAPRTL